MTVDNIYWFEHATVCLMWDCEKYELSVLANGVETTQEISEELALMLLRILDEASAALTIKSSVMNVEERGI